MRTRAALNTLERVRSRPITPGITLIQNSREKLFLLKFSYLSFLKTLLAQTFSKTKIEKRVPPKKCHYFFNLHGIKEMIIFLSIKNLF